MAALACVKQGVRFAWPGSGPPGVRSSIEARLRLPADPASAHRARAFACHFLETSGIPAQSDIVLLVSELVTNAVLHGREAIELSLTLRGGVIRVEVADAAGTLPELQHPSAADDHGRGLMLVDSISRAWGARVIPNHGKRVWCEIEIA